MVILLPKERGRVINKKKINWQDWIITKDVVIVEIASFMVDRAGWGFVEDVLAVLRGEPPPSTVRTPSPPADAVPPPREWL